MKISKSSLLTLSLIFTTLGLWAMAVSTSERQLYINLNNASQYMETIQFISTWSNPAYLRQIGNGSIKIQTNNFILTQTWDNENIISGKNYSSILWWEKNYIEWNGKNIILWWKDNSINGEYNVILWWEWNKIENWKKYSVILWWKENTEDWNYSVILGSNNTIEGTGSIVVWNSWSVKGDFSAALWNNSNVEANNSFLWTDGSTTETLTQDNVFVVIAESGMIINTNQAHRFTKLTIWWPLVLSNKDTDKNIQCTWWNGWWILKIENADNQMCLCSCDGSWRNSMLGKGRCMGICDSSIKPQCGNDVKRIKVWDHIEYSWSCNFWVPVKWTWSYLVTKNSKVHWSCQTDDGQVIECSGTATGLPYNSCNGTAPNGEWVIKWNSSYVNWFWGWNTTWTYTENENPWTCEYTCNTANGYHRDEASQSCKNTYNCSWTVPWANTRTWSNTTTNPNQEWTYVQTEWELWTCKWTCINSSYIRTWENNYCGEKPHWLCWIAHFSCDEGESTDNITWATERTWKCWDTECKECRTDLWYLEDSNGDCINDNPFTSCCENKPLNSKDVINPLLADWCYYKDVEISSVEDGYCTFDSFWGESCNYTDNICGSITNKAICEWSTCCTRNQSSTDPIGGTPQEIIEEKFFRCNYEDGYINRPWTCLCEKISGSNPSCAEVQWCSSYAGYEFFQSYGGKCYRTCFTAWTKVTISDGTQKNIEDVKIWEKVLWSNWTINTVLWYDRPILWNRHLWSINGWDYFVSDEHPFMTTEWWKSFNPEMTNLEINLKTTKLKVWDILIRNWGLEKVKSIDYIDGNYNTPLYNLILDGDHTYYANNYLVHNKTVYPWQVLWGSCPWTNVPYIGGIDTRCCPSGYNGFLGWRCVIECWLLTLTPY